MEREDLWAPIEALARTFGAKAAVQHTYRPEEIVSRVRAPSTLGGAPLPRAPSTLGGAPLPRAPSTLALGGAPLPQAPRRPIDAPGADVKILQTAPERARPRSVEAMAEAESFEIRDLIGQGGMGLVWKAVQGSLHREVAIKQISPGFEEASAQFFAEAHVMARLEHANIIPVHLLGRTATGEPLLAMKLVKGTSWRDLIHTPVGDELDLEEHLRILLAVCNAMAFAHRQGFLHRDLKPENVMVGEFGQVFVMDWGIAVGIDRAAVEEAPGRPPMPSVRDPSILYVDESRSPAGTPAYMAPELAMGQGERQDARTDIYLLGACLHEVVTRELRHRGETVRDVLERAVESRPFAYSDAVPKELAAICNRATARDLGDRFPSVEALQEAIEGFLEHREARAMTAKGRALVEKLRALVAGCIGKTAEAAAEEEREIHDCYAEARFALEHALGRWDGAVEAREGLHEAHRALLEHALATDDLALAIRILPKCDTPETRAGVGALRARAEARTREIEALRETARRLDWSAIAPSLGTVFIAAGLLGGAGVIATRLALRYAPTRSVLFMGLLWALVMIGSGLLARAKLQGGRAPDSLRSPQVVGTWAAVAAGCFMNELIVGLQGQQPFGDARSSTLMIGIGFAAMALQTRRWLLAPAVAFFVGAIVTGMRTDLGMEIFGGLWVVTLVGVGLAFKLGATLGEPENKS